MYIAVAVGNIQAKSRFTVGEGELRNSTVAEGGIVLKGRWDISWLKNPQGVVPLPNQPNLFLILRVIQVFVMQSSNHPYLHILHQIY